MTVGELKLLSYQLVMSPGWGALGPLSSLVREEQDPCVLSMTVEGGEVVLSPVDDVLS